MTETPALDAVALGRWMDAECLPGEGADVVPAVWRVAERAVPGRARWRQSRVAHPCPAAGSSSGGSANRSRASESRVFPMQESEGGTAGEW
jgi:hypothetical protein